MMQKNEAQLQKILDRRVVKGRSIIAYAYFPWHRRPCTAASSSEGVEFSLYRPYYSYLHAVGEILVGSNVMPSDKTSCAADGIESSVQ